MTNSALVGHLGSVRFKRDRPSILFSDLDREKREEIEREIEIERDRGVDGDAETMPDALEVTFTDSGSLGLTFAESPTGFAVLKTRPEGQARGKKLKVGYVLVAVGE